MGSGCHLTRWCGSVRIASRSTDGCCGSSGVDGIPWPNSSETVSASSAWPRGDPRPSTPWCPCRCPRCGGSGAASITRRRLPHAWHERFRSRSCGCSSMAATEPRSVGRGPSGFDGDRPFAFIPPRKVVLGASPAWPSSTTFARPGRRFDRPPGSSRSAFLASRSESRLPPSQNARSRAVGGNDRKVLILGQ